MPRTRRKSSQAQQKTLAFGPQTNKITKPSLPASTTYQKPTKPSPLAKAALEEIISTPSPPTSANEDDSQEEDEKDAPTTKKEQERLRLLLSPGGSGGGGKLTIREPKKVEKPKRSAAEERAEKVGEAEVRKYWRAVEEERKTRRVHQEGLPINEKILRHFDLSSQYGPCIGIPRLNRWTRASNLGLDPPIEVLAVLMKEAAKTDKNSDDGAGAAGMAYVDELLNNRSGS